MIWTSFAFRTPQPSRSLTGQVSKTHPSWHFSRFGNMFDLSFLFSLTFHCLRCFFWLMKSAHCAFCTVKTSARLRNHCKMSMIFLHLFLIFIRERQMNIENSISISSRRHMAESQLCKRRHWILAMNVHRAISSRRSYFRLFYGPIEASPAFHCHLTVPVASMLLIVSLFMLFFRLWFAFSNRLCTSWTRLSRTRHVWVTWKAPHWEWIVQIRVRVMLLYRHCLRLQLLRPRIYRIELCRSLRRCQWMIMMQTSRLTSFNGCMSRAGVSRFQKRALSSCNRHWK